MSGLGIMRPPMPAHAAQFSITTAGKGTYEITDRCEQVVQLSGIQTGVATIFVQHTSCSLLIFENADPSARTDLHPKNDYSTTPQRLDGRRDSGTCDDFRIRK